MWQAYDDFFVMGEQLFSLLEESSVTYATVLVPGMWFWIDHLEMIKISVVSSWIYYFKTCWKWCRILCIQFKMLYCEGGKIEHVDCKVWNLLRMRVFIMDMRVHWHFTELFVNGDFLVHFECLWPRSQPLVHTRCWLQTSSVGTA